MSHTADDAMTSRNFSDVLVRVDAEVPLDHPVRAAGWDSAVRALHASYAYAAPEIVGSLWSRLGNACSLYFIKYAELGEAWPLRASAVLSNKPVESKDSCCCCQSPSKEELDAMIKAHPERLVTKAHGTSKDVMDAAEALLLLHKSQTPVAENDVTEGARALLMLRK